MKFTIQALFVIKVKQQSSKNQSNIQQTQKGLSVDTNQDNKVQ